MIDVGDPALLIWLVFDPVAAQWDDCTVDVPEFNKFSEVKYEDHEPGAEGETNYGPTAQYAQDFMRMLVDGQYDLIKLFDSIRDWPSATKTNIDALFNKDKARRFSANPNFMYPSRQDLVCGVATLKDAEANTSITPPPSTSNSHSPESAARSSPSNTGTSASPKDQDDITPGIDSVVDEAGS